MNSASTQFLSFKRVGTCEPNNQHRSWADYFNDNGKLDTAMSMIMEAGGNIDAQSENTSHGTLVANDQYEQEANKYNSKVHRRLAQNREAARKSRLRKKAYVQQLESSRIKLVQLEQELEQARQQGLLIGSGLEASHLGISKAVHSGVASFEMEYGIWVEEHNRQTCELRNALSVQTSDVELGILVESTMCHYSELFRLKATAAKADVVYLMSGMWKTSAERLFLWIGGLRPSELLKVFLPQLDPLTDEQIFDIYNLKQSCQQAEDALTQGMDRLQQTLTEAVAFSHPGEGSYIPLMSPAMERLESLVSFIIQADHLRHETLQQVFRILTTHQAARGLLALGEYLQRLRALSSLWATRPQK